MKKSIITLMLTLSVSAAKADDFLTFQLSDSQTQSLAIGDRLEMAINGNTLTVGDVSFALTDLNKMFFTESVSVGETGWGTYSSTKCLDYTAVDGLTVYSAQFDDYAGTIVLTELTEAVPGGEGVVVSAASGHYYVPVVTAANALSDNDLIGTCSTAVTAEGTNYYALAQVGDSNVGFCRVASGEEIPVNKAYYVANSGNQARYLISTETTAIEKVPAATSNGDDAIYDLHGRRVTTPTKGIYIKNGKKIVYTSSTPRD